MSKLGKSEMLHGKKISAAEGDVSRRRLFMGQESRSGGIGISRQGLGWQALGPVHSNVYSSSGRTCVLKVIKKCLKKCCVVK